MFQTCVLFISLMSWSYCQESSEKLRNVGINFKQQIVREGYPLEVHKVITDDGYSLELQRIPFGIKSALKTPQNKPVVLLVSGFLTNAADWVVMGPEKGLGFILADNGCDVWLGNNRGTTWSRKHVYLNPDTNKKAFWNFSLHELGYYDLPALIDYVLGNTHQNKLFYVGYSLGTTQYFIMNSNKPEYNNKVRLAITLAPVFYASYLAVPSIRLMAVFLNNLQTLSEKYNYYEFLPHTPLITLLGEYLCNDNSAVQEVCEIFLLSLGGHGSTQLNKTTIPMIFNNFPAGASVKMLFHAAQIYKSKIVGQYDYGEEENIRKYRLATPPKYDITKVTSPVALYYGDKDPFCVYEDINRTIADLPNVVEHRLIQGFNHLDYVWGRNVVNILYYDILKLMERF